MSRATREPLAALAEALGVTGGADLDALTDVCLRRLAGGPDEAVAREALADLQDLRVEIAERSVAARAERIDRVEHGLERLRGIGSSGALVERVCEELVRSCGLERVLLSRVEDGHWRPWMVNDVVRTEDWFDAWAERSIPLGEFVLETELLAARRAALVTSTDDERVHPIIRAGHSGSYLVAPLVAAGDVVGFLHADHGIGGRPCTETDREVLWAFAEGFAHLYERATLLERLRAQRTRVRETLFLVDVTLQQLQAADVALSRGVDPAPVRPDAAAALATLTRRERQILEQLATGASNQQIADRLVLGLSTVKTHVKHVLAKLGASNRAQAIALLLEGRSSSP